MQSSFMLVRDPMESQRNEGDSMQATDSINSSCKADMSDMQSTNSESTLSSQSSLSEMHEREANKGEKMRRRNGAVNLDEIQAKEEDLPTLFSKEELYMCVISVTNRKQMEQQFKLNILNKDDALPQLDDPSPYLYHNTKAIVLPEVKTLDCRVIDKKRLEERQRVLNALHRPYHPLLYTTIELSP